MIPNYSKFGQPIHYSLLTTPSFMAFTAEQQATELINRAKQILVITKDHAGIDTIAAALAMGLWLQKLHKTFDIVVPNFDQKSLPSFLPTQPLLRPSIGAMRAFHVSVDVSRVPLSELMYDVKNGKLDITLVPKSGEWSLQDATFKPGDDRYDLVMALDSPDMASLGEASKNHAEFFMRTTIINIDCHPTNEYWGQVNLVDLNAVSSTEILHGWIERTNHVLIDAPLATCLLTGMVAKTKSFRTANVTHQTLQAASMLIEKGAEREKIVQGLWRNQSIANLKLWGRILARLNQDKELGLVWSVLTESDFAEIGVPPDALHGVVDELLAYAPEARVIAFIWQHASQIFVSIYTTTPLSAAELARPFGGSGTRDRAMFPYRESQNVTEASTKIVERLRETLRTLQS